MKSFKLWFMLTLVVLGLMSGMSSGGGGGETVTTASVEVAQATQQPTEATHAEPPSPLRSHWELLRPALVDYETQRVNQTIIAAQSQALREGRQPLDVVKDWQRSLAAQYLAEVQAGKDAKARQDLIQRYSYALLAESVIVNAIPMQAVNIDERAIACQMAVYLNLQNQEGCGNASDEQQQIPSTGRTGSGLG